MNAIIVDDELLARQYLRERLTRYADINVIAEASNGFEAFKLIHELKPDAVFLDIQMPKITGLELLEILEEMPLIVFITAYDQFALQAFAANAVDYLMKPFSDERLDATIGRLRLKQAENRSDTARLRSFLAENGEPLNKIVIKDGNKAHVISVDDVILIEAQDDYISICTPEKKYLKKSTMKSIEGRLSNEQFFRIHRSYIVNSDWIKQIITEGKDSYSLILKTGAKLPVSKNGYDLLKRLFV